MGEIGESIGKINLQSLTNNKIKRGMGFSEVIHVNSSLLAKQAWRVIHNLDAL